MTLIHTQQFSFEDKNYEIRVFSSGWEISIRVFEGEKPANGYTYAVSLPTAFDLEKIYNTDAVKALIDKAESDIRSKLWEKYVTAYIDQLTTTEEEQMGCLKCTSRNIASSKVDGRKMFECLDCQNIWYEQRSSTNGPCSIIDTITDGVSENGSHEIDTEILLNGVFSPFMSDLKLPFDDQLRNWANQNKLQYDEFTKNTENGMRPYTRFWR